MTTTRDELRVRLAADVAGYIKGMASAEIATRKVDVATGELRKKALGASGVATGLSESLVVLTGSSTAAARGLTAVNVASKALAITPAGAVMTALGVAVGFLVDNLTRVEPETEKAEVAVESFAIRVDHSAKRIAEGNKQLAEMRDRVRDLTVSTEDLALGEERSLQRRQKELEGRAREQSAEVERIRELTARFSDAATAELRTGEALQKYLETEKELVVVAQRLGEIREREREERRRDAESRQQERDRELASVVQLAQRRVGGATAAAQREEAERVAAMQRQVDTLKAQVMTGEERLDIEQEIADTLREQGRITEEDHRRRSIQIAAAREELSVWHEDYLRRLEDAAADRKKAADEMAAAVTTVRDITNDLVSSGVNTFFNEWTRDLEGAQRVAAELLRTVVQVAQQALVARLASSAASAGSGDAGWPRFASGGYVRGPGTATSDSVVARLSRGEYVVRAAAVERVGVGLLEAINEMKAPRFAAGGRVDSGAPSPQVNVAVMRDERELARFMSSREGESIVIGHLKRNGR